MRRGCRLSLVIAVLTMAMARASAADAPAAPPAASPPAAQAPAETPAQKLDALYARLAVAKDSEEADGIVAAIGRLHVQSGSDAGDLLLARALTAIHRQDYDASQKILDSAIVVLPDWAEAWNTRATVRYLAGDYDGSMADIAETLKREPRHLGALSGMGLILEAEGKREEALKVYQRALAIAPHLSSAEGAADRLKAALAGQAL